MKRRMMAGAAFASLLSLAACTGGDMGNTRGGGAAPGQSGGPDTAATRPMNGAAVGASTSTTGGAMGGATGASSATGVGA
ncbi:MAG TPA: hypothetical protein VJU87_08815, partial [Gemmatimonadaceae bacterium]|nr:hypothetical protein [Gemmatimonadaceae bacterium]